MFSKNSEAKIDLDTDILEEEQGLRTGSGRIIRQIHACVLPPVCIDHSRGSSTFISGIPTNVYIGTGSIWQCDCGESYTLVKYTNRAGWEKVEDA